MVQPIWNLFERWIGPAIATETQDGYNPGKAVVVGYRYRLLLSPASRYGLRAVPPISVFRRVRGSGSREELFANQPPRKYSNLRAAL